MNNLFHVSGATLLALSVTISGCQPRSTLSPKPVPTPKTVPTPTRSPIRPPAPEEPASTAQASGGPRPYTQVIPKSAQTSRGLFVTHRVGTKVYFEIPASALDTDMLLFGRYIKTSGNPSDGPFPGDQFLERILRWERREHKIFLRLPSYKVVADSSKPIARAVTASNVYPIMNSFDVLTYGPDSAAVIDVTTLFLSAGEFSALGKGRGADASRSFIERVVAYPENVIIESTQTGAAQQASGPAAQQQQNVPLTVVAHWSLVQLPKVRMMPRLSDARIGFFTVSQTDFGTREHRAARKDFITRWRLEKKDPSAVLSEPVKPIIYYVDPATPDFLKPYIKAAIESWQPAFEAAGFKHAILAKDVPVDDSAFSMDDVRNTVIRWLPSTQENAQGPQVNDPRTGEILNGSIRMFHNIMNLQRSWYFTQAGPLDPRAMHWPFPDSLMGRLVQYVAAHEIGHTLGFTHNHKASSTYPVDSLRSISWLTRMGHAPSIMDYARFNYVAQPEDSIPVNLLIPDVGPYDKFATMWGYAPVQNARTPEDERPTLDQWARMQDTIPWYRFGNGAETGIKGNPDFGDAMEAVGDADAVRSSTLGIKNLKRIIPMLLTVAVKQGEDYSDLAEMYDRVLSQWAIEVSHVVNIIGGVDMYTKYGGQPGDIYKPVSRQRQVDAMRFLKDNVFTMPEFLLDDRIVRRLEPDGKASRILDFQEMIIGRLLAQSRTSRMVEFQSRAEKLSDVYTIKNLLTDLRHGIWGELSASTVVIDLNRRALQREHLKVYEGILNAKAPVQQKQAIGEIVAGIRAELMQLQSQVATALTHTSNYETRAHLLDVTQRLRMILDPKS